MKTTQFLLVLFLSFFLLMGTSMAVTVLPGNETPLQTVLDDITVGGDSSIDVNEDQINDEFDSTWSITASTGSIATLIIEIAGYAGTNSFGIYDVNDINNRLTLFGGPDNQLDSTTLHVSSDAQGGFNFDSYGVYDTGFRYNGSATFSTQNFGYYLSGTDSRQNTFTFFSDTLLNEDEYDHMVAYQGNDQDVISLDGGQTTGTWTDNEYILAWEDLMGGGDEDFNDMVLIVESVEPVPEPGTIALLGMGLLGLAYYARKRKIAKN